MAQYIRLTSGSIFNNNPITFSVKPDIIVGTDGAPLIPAFHRIIFEVTCGMSGGNYQVVRLTSPVESEGDQEVEVDISSALRMFRDSYDYTPEAAEYPVVKFNVCAYDEYMIDGDVVDSAKVYFPKNPSALPPSQRDEAYLSTVFGGFSDLERITSGPTRGVQAFSNKPSSTPEIVKVGETYAYPLDYDAPVLLPEAVTVARPQTVITTITKAGLQTIGTHTVYALPANAPQPRAILRFVNSFGVMESISILAPHSESMEVRNEHYNVTCFETFNRMSHLLTRKSDNFHTYRLSTGPLDRQWHYWFTSQLLMVEETWIQLPVSLYPELAGVFVRCHIIAEDTLDIINTDKDDPRTVDFKVKLDIRY